MRREGCIGLLVALVGCRSPASATVVADDAGSPSTTTITAASAMTAAASATGSVGPPPPVVTCTRNEDCAVATVDVRGPTACCLGCATTPGTRAWYADLQLWCGAHPPADCPPLACPLASTRAICDHGTCSRTALAPEDGGPDFITTEEKCLPVLACSGGVGCARVRGDFQNGWYLADPLRASFGALPVGSEVTLEKDLCTPHAPGKCSGARLVPRSVTCPPQSVPPLVPPPKPCVLTGTSCHA